MTAGAHLGALIVAAVAGLTALALTSGHDAIAAAIAVLPVAGASLLQGRVPRGAWAAIVAGGAGAALWAVTRGGGVEEVVGFALVVLLTHHVLADPVARSPRIVLLLSSLLLVAGAARSQHPVFGALWLAWTVAAPLALWEGSSGRHHPAPARRAAAGLALTTTLLAGAVFVWLPRPTVDRPDPLTGLAEDVSLAGFDRLHDDPRTAATLRSMDGPLPDHVTLRAAALEGFDGRRWTREAPLRPVPTWASGAGWEVEIEHEDAGGAVLLPGAPARLDGVDVVQDVADAWRTRDRGPVAFRATIVRGTTLGAPSLWPHERARALALPDLDPRVTALATELTRSLPTDRARIRAVAEHVRTRHRYTRATVPEAADPVAAFLFEHRSGHCELFATATAVLLRASGVPARVVTGFAHGRVQDEALVFRRADAHAWVEAHVDGEGWRSIDATGAAPALAHTPSAPRDATPTSTTPPVVATSWGTGLENAWMRWVVRYDGGRQAALAHDLRRRLATPVGISLLLGLGVAVTVGLLRRRWLRSPAGRLGRSTPRTGVAGAWDAALQAVLGAGLTPPDALAPVPAARWLAPHLGEVGPLLVRLAWLHAEVRWGRADEAARLAEAKRLSDAIVAGATASSPTPSAA